MHCSKISSIHEAKKRLDEQDLAPECECGGYLKPDTISFGQSMPSDEVEAATRFSTACDCFVVVGSTLLVHPAAGMPVWAKRNGAFLAIVNLSDTPCDDMADLVIRATAGDALPAAAREARALAERS